LLGVIQFGGAADFFPEDVVDVSEGLLEHGLWFRLRAGWVWTGPCIGKLFYVEMGGGGKDEREGASGKWPVTIDRWGLEENFRSQNGERI